jgi:hypothetical protein
LVVFAGSSASARQPRPTALRNPFATASAIGLVDLRDPFDAGPPTADPAFDDGSADAEDPLQADPAFDAANEPLRRLSPLEDLRIPPAFLCTASPSSLPDLRAPVDR